MSGPTDWILRYIKTTFTFLTIIIFKVLWEVGGEREGGGEGGREGERERGRESERGEGVREREGEGGREGWSQGGS